MCVEFRILLVNYRAIESTVPHIRPRFKIETTHTQEEILGRIKILLKNAPHNIKGQIVNNHVTLDITGEDVHYWSPQLNFRVEPNEQYSDHSVVSGLIGPRPAVWTMFMFIYAAIGVIAFFISLFAVSKIMLGKPTNSIYAFPIALLFMFTAYLVGKYGEKLAKDQTELLKQFVRDATYFSTEKQRSR